MKESKNLEEKTKTAGQIDGEVLFTAGQFAWCPALNEPPELVENEFLKAFGRIL